MLRHHHASMSPRRRTLLILAAVGAPAGLLALAWFHLIPGGWLLRDLLEDPALRAERRRQAHRAARLRAFAEESAPPGAVVFLGSSTIEHFPLERLFPGIPVVNRGIGGEPAAELAARLRRSLPPAPAGFVVYTGAADFHRMRAGPEEVSRDVVRVLTGLAELHPEAPVALLGILPARDMSAAELKALHALNASLERAAQAQGTAFVPTGGPPLAGPDGSLDPGLSRDSHHLDLQGYRHMAERLQRHGGPVGRLLSG